MGYLVIFGFSRFGRNDFFLHFFHFRFRSKMPFALSQKYYIRNWTVTTFCDIIGTGDFRFRFSAQKRVLFSSAFSFTAENERCIFGRPLHQTVSDYTLRRWFSNIQQSGFQKAGRCLEMLVLPSILDTCQVILLLHHHHHHRHCHRVVRVTVAPLRDSWRSQISTA